MTVQGPATPAAAAASVNDLSSFWMPFTANRQFKAAPRMLVGAQGMHYTTADCR
jgi:beta-alanine--pyruvate transaminase